MSRWIRSMAVVAVLAVGMADTVQASPVSDRSPLETLGRWLGSWLSPDRSGLTAVWTRAGGMMDPNGTPGDEGGMMDPDGLTSDEGSMMDPNGF
jgi:hypothetical protein